MLNAGQDNRISIYQTYFVFVPLFLIIYEKLARVFIIGGKETEICKKERTKYV